MPDKTRDPGKDLYHSDYLTWIKDVDKYFDDHPTDPEYPAALHAALKPLIPVFQAALADYQTKKDDADATSTDYTTEYVAMLGKLRLCRELLPTIIADESAPAEFSLKDKLPEDRDDLWVRAQACVTNWAQVCDPAVPAEYLPLQPHFDEVATIFAAYSDAKDAYHAAYLYMTDAQNTMLETRAACHKVERDIFKWVGAFHKSGKDEYWTETPWGCTGQSEPGQLPAVTGLSLDFVDPNLTITWDAVAGADGYKLQMGNNPLILGTTLYVGPDTGFTFDPPGGHLYFRVWAMKGEEMGLPGEAVDIEIAGVAPVAPHGLKVTREGVYLKWEWKYAAGSPEYFRLYIATVPTGSPPPSRPAEPEHDELITLTVSTFAPTMGNTVYGWVTAFGDGAESEASGPVSIDIV